MKSPTPGSSGMTRSKGGDKDDIWEGLQTVKVQGNSLRTWPLASSSIESVQVLMKTDGRPLNALFELWNGPDYTPAKMQVYIEDGLLCPFNAVMATPGGSNTIAIRNTNSIEFPLDACLGADLDGTAAKSMAEKMTPKLCQGGSVSSFPFDPEVERVQVLLKTDGRNIKARVELMQGPNNDKQVYEYYASNGKKHPFFVIIESPGVGNVVRITNENTVEFPFYAVVEALDS
jgi:hypothetical protein